MYCECLNPDLEYMETKRHITYTCAICKKLISRKEKKGGISKIRNELKVHLSGQYNELHDKINEVIDELNRRWYGKNN